MPTLLRVGQYRFFIYSVNYQEPPHVHVEWESNVAKFWLTPVRMQSSGGFKRNEINRIYRVIEENWTNYGEVGMSAVVIEIRDIAIQDVAISEDALTVNLLDGRSISVPLAWYPRLWHGTEAERNNWRLIGQGMGIHWPDLDEDISVEGLIWASIE